jgi:hypothetical protein
MTSDEAVTAPPTEPYRAAEPAGAAPPAPYGPAPYGTGTYAPEPYASEAPAPGPRRRGARGVLRWTAAVAVFAVLGGAAAYAVTRPERTRIPGLATPGDGRWTFPTLSLPKLPAGKPAALDDKRNPAGVHYADPRVLLLPAPAASGARVTRRPGWEGTGDFLTLFTAGDRTREGAELAEQGCRHIVAEAWTMPDGTRVSVHLAQFPTHGLAVQYQAGTGAQSEPAGATGAQPDHSMRTEKMPLGASQNLYKAGSGAVRVRYGFVLAGDTVALIVQHAPASAGAKAAVTFHQTVLLQAQMLG